MNNQLSARSLELAWIQSANGVRMIFGGLALGVWGRLAKRIVTAMGAIMISGIGLIVFSLIPPNLFG